jgi:hypothetical protein
VDGSGIIGFGNPAKLDYAIGGGRSATSASRIWSAWRWAPHERCERGCSGPCGSRGQILPNHGFPRRRRGGRSTALNRCLAHTPAKPHARWPWCGPISWRCGYADGLKGPAAAAVRSLPAARGERGRVGARASRATSRWWMPKAGPAREVSVTAGPGALPGAPGATLQSSRAILPRHGIDYLRTSTAMPFQELILRHLRRGGFLR